MSKSTPVLESEKSGMKTQLPASLVAMCCSPAIAILNSESLPLLLNHHTAQARPAARPAPIVQDPLVFTQQVEAARDKHHGRPSPASSDAAHPAAWSGLSRQRQPPCASCAPTGVRTDNRSRDPDRPRTHAADPRSVWSCGRAQRLNLGTESRFREFSDSQVKNATWNCTIVPVRVQARTGRRNS